MGESLACGNLGLVGSRKGDAKTAKACLERHLKLAVALRDPKAQLDASEILGVVGEGGAVCLCAQPPPPLSSGSTGVGVGRGGGGGGSVSVWLGGLKLSKCMSYGEEDICM